MSDRVVFLAEVVAYDPAIPGTRTLRYSSGQGHVTGPAESPASTFYDPRMKQPALVKRDLFQSGTTQGRSRVGYGDLVLLNGDGALDELIEYGFDGRAITIREGRPGAAYPSGFSTVLVGTMEQAEFSVSEVRIKLRDRQFEMQKPLQPTKYAGSNAPPAGLEGVTDIKGKPKPVLYGSVSNVPAVLVNTSKLIFQVAAVLTGAACNGINAVYDRGISLGGSFPLSGPHTFGSGFSSSGSLAFGNGVFVAVGNAGLIFTSPDGITWTSRTSPLGSGLDVAFGDGLFVMVGETGQMATSTDGVTWTSRTSGFGTTKIYGVGYGSGLWVAVGELGTMTTSTNGTTGWTSRVSGFGATTIYGVGYGNGMWVAVGDSGTLTSSANGTTGWTLRTSTFGVSHIYAIEFGNGLFIAVGEIGKIASSADAILWQARNSGIIGDIVECAYANGQFIAAGFSAEVSLSQTGLVWAKRTSGLGALVISGLAFGNNVLVAIASAGSSWTSARPADYASEAELLNDALAPVPGAYKTYPPGGYFRLGSSPAGVVTADVTQGAAAANRTAGQIWGALLTRAGLASGTDYNATDITALDTANSAVLGYYADAETTFEKALDDVAGSVGAWWGPDRAGVFRIRQLIAPTGTAVISLTANDLLKAPERVPTQDLGHGLPVFRSIVRYAKNYTVQTTDLAAGVSDARRGVVGREWREASETTASVQTKHLLSPELLEDSLLTTEADATAEATRRQTLRGTRKDRYSIQVKLDATTAAVDMGDVIELTHSRFGLSAGKKFIVLGLEPDANDRVLTLSIWG